MHIPKGSKLASFAVQTCAECGESHYYLIKRPLWLMVGSGGKGAGKKGGWESFCPKCEKKLNL